MPRPRARGVSPDARASRASSARSDGFMAQYTIWDTAFEISTTPTEVMPISPMPQA